LEMTCIALVQLLRSQNKMWNFQNYSMDLPKATTTPSESKELSLMEEVLLLCLRNTGDVSSAIFGYSEVSTGNGLAGAAVMELTLRGRIQILKKENTNTEVFVVVGSGSTGDDILDEAIDIMRDKKDATLGDWLKLINGTLVFHKGIKDHRERLYQRLCSKGILREVKKVVGKSKHTFKDVTAVEKVADKIRKWGQITDPAKGPELSDRDFALMALFYSLDKPFANKVGNCLDINRIFPDINERTEARKNLEALVNNETSKADSSDITGQVAKQVSRKIFVYQIKVMTMGIFSMLTEL